MREKNYQGSFPWVFFSPSLRIKMLHHTGKMPLTSPWRQWSHKPLQKLILNGTVGFVLPCSLHLPHFYKGSPFETWWKSTFFKITEDHRYIYVCVYTHTSHNLTKHWGWRQPFQPLLGARHCRVHTFSRNYLLQSWSNQDLLILKEMTIYSIDLSGLLQILSSCRQHKITGSVQMHYTLSILLLSQHLPWLQAEASQWVLQSRETSWSDSVLKGNKVAKYIIGPEKIVIPL